jgi:hypothetical protein
MLFTRASYALANGLAGGASRRIVTGPEGGSNPPRGVALGGCFAQAKKIAPGDKPIGDGLGRAARYGLQAHRRATWGAVEEPVRIVGEAHGDPRSLRNYACGVSFVRSSRWPHRGGRR